MTSIGTIIFTALFGKKVGIDEFGNKYYQTKFFSKNIGMYGKQRRWVIFNGKAEASKIPPYWHGWMHYTFDDIPTEQAKNQYDWEKEYLPNLTGTGYAYLPPGHSEKGGERDKATGDYQAWKP